MRHAPAGQSLLSWYEPTRARPAAGIALRSALPLIWLLACSQAAGGSTPAPARPLTPFPEEKSAETIFDRGLGPGWKDYGWATRDLQSGGPARIDFSRYSGWIICHPGLTGRFGALRFRMRAPGRSTDFLEVHLDSARADLFPRVRGPAHRDLQDGWLEVRIPMEVLNPDHLPFDRIVLRAHVPIQGEGTEIDQIELTADSGGSGQDATSSPVKVKEVHMSVDCTAPGLPIHDMIYGIAYSAGGSTQDAYVWSLGATARRWGGNPSSRYNWQLGNAWNTASDWFFRNTGISNEPGFSYRTFLREDIAAGIKSALTVPTLGWVAMDTESFSFPVSTFGAQQQVDPYQTEAGNGVTQSGALIDPGPQSLTSVPAPPEFIGRWVAKIREEDRKEGARGVQLYILDNEPELWNSTHRDVHPAPVSYDELLKRTIDYASAVRKADPQATIAGPASWGWPAYSYSAVDAATKFKLNPDRLAHGDKPLLAWWLQKVREQEKRTGLRLIDVLDVHFYPMADGVGGKGGVDRETAAKRIRSTRALWDPTYVDESWIGTQVQLFPRLHRWIDENAPGVGIAIGEYNFGAEDHISGGLALAEVLGRFGQNDVSAAFYWMYPPKNSPTFWAFRAYRNFDAQGGHFLERSLPARAEEGSSLFVSRDAAGSHLVAIALNFHPDLALDATIALNGSPRVVSQKAYAYSPKSQHGFEEQPAKATDSSLVAHLEPYSITVFDVQLAAKGGQPGDLPRLAP